MTWLDLRLALGAFLTSPGFGAVAAITAAVIAYQSIVRRVQEDRADAQRDRGLALVDDERQRWWDAATWLWDNREALPLVEVIVLMTALAQPDVATTGTQIAFLQAMRRSILPPSESEESE